MYRPICDKAIVHGLAARGAASWRRTGFSWALLLILAGTFLLPGSPTLAQEADGDQQELDTRVAFRRGAEPAEGGQSVLGGDKAVELELEDVVLQALRNNLTLVVERYRRSQSILGIVQNRGIYDLGVNFNLSINSDTSPTQSTLEAADVLEQDRAQANMRITQLTPLGGTARLDFNNSRFASSNIFVQPNPQFGIGLDLTFTQPLLRNFGRFATERNLIVAKTNAQINREEFQIQVEDVIQQVTDGYWNLVESREQLTVARESLELAGELHEMNRIQVDVGTLAPLEMVQSEAGVAARQEDIIRLEAQVEDNADVLRRLMNLEPGVQWDIEIVPVTEPEVAHRTVDLEQAIALAYEKRPDVKRRLLQNETLELDAKVAQNQRKPQLDVFSTFGFNAVDGDLADVDQATGIVTPIASRGYEDALSQILGGDFEGWTVGVTFSYPLQNRDAKARAAIADLALGQGSVELRNLKLQVLTDVRTAARALETAAQRIESSKVSSRLARKNLEAEQKRYENGLSTSFEVLQIQEDLSEARSREVSAIINYRRAETAYYRAIGQLLDKYDVLLSEDMPAEDSFPDIPLFDSMAQPSIFSR